MASHLFQQKVSAVQSAISRARTVFLISNLATISIIGAVFNLYLTWLNYSITRAADQGKPAENILHALQEAKIRDLRMISIPVLGSKFYAADIGIIASLTMLVLAVWLFYSFRREQHSVGRLILEITDQKHPGSTSLRIRESFLDEAQYALFALSTTFVFITTEKAQAIGDVGKSRDKTPLIARWARVALFSAPTWVVMLCAVADLTSLFKPSALYSSSPSTSLWMAMASHPDQQTEALVRILFTLSSALVIGRIMRHANYYQDWTQKLYSGLSTAVAESEGTHDISNRTEGETTTDSQLFLDVYAVSMDGTLTENS
jgi:hypothetical protein